MRIATNTVSDTILNQVQQLSLKQLKLQTQVATGQRITQPEDDSRAVGHVLNLQSGQRQIAQYGKNATRAMELAQATFSSLQSLKSVSDRANEIGALGNGILSSSGASAYAGEVNQLIEHTLEVANGKFRGESLFSGTAVDTVPFTATRNAAGDITGVSYGGNTGRAQIQISETSTVAVSPDGATNTSIGTFIAHLVSLRDALAGNNSTAISSAEASLTGDEDGFVAVLADHGGIQARIEAVQSQQKTIADNLEASVSSEADVDLPATIVKLNQTQTAYQAALQSAANIMRLSLLDYLK